MPLGDRRLGVQPLTADNANYEQTLARAGLRGGEPLVVLHSPRAGATDGWPVANFTQIAIRLVNNFGVRIVVADEPYDGGFSKALAAAGLPQGAITLAEPRAVEFAAALARASVFVTDEPHAAKMAVELGAPALEIADIATRPRRSNPPAGGDSTRQRSARAHRIARGSSRVRVSADVVFELAVEMLQESRTPSLIQHFGDS